MEDLNDKAVDGTLPASEWNQVPSEIQNVIEALGIALSSGDLNQLGKAISGYVANGTFYTDSGIADAYVLTQIGSKQAVPAYTVGMIARFFPVNANTGASTVIVSGLGSVAIEKGGVALVAGDIEAGDSIEMWYDGTAFQIVQSSVTSTTTVAGLIKLTTNSLQEAAVDNTVAVTPGRQHFHPSAAKAWVTFRGDPSVLVRDSYNVSSVTDNGVGDYTVNFSTSFSDAFYALAGAVTASTSVANTVLGRGDADLKSTSACQVKTRTVGGTQSDPDEVYAIFFGDQ